MVLNEFPLRTEFGLSYLSVSFAQEEKVNSPHGVVAALTMVDAAMNVHLVPINKRCMGASSFRLLKLRPHFIPIWEFDWFLKLSRSREIMAFEIR